MKTIVGVGEVLAAVRPVGYAAFGDTNQVVVAAGGSEVNVLGKLSGLSSDFHSQAITKIKDDLMGRFLRSDLQKYKVGTDHIVWCNDHRNGFCFVEQGLGPITAEGQYDREYSAFSKANPKEFDFSIIEQASALFISGITPALSTNCLKITREVLKNAKKNSVPVFFDVNYRNKLWATADAREAIMSLIAKNYIYCLITTESDARKVFGAKTNYDDDQPIDDLVGCSKKILSELFDIVGTKVPVLIMTVRKRISNETGQWSSVALIEGAESLTGDVFDYTVLDRYGAGDSCSAGIIGGFLGVTEKGDVIDNLTLSERVQNGLNLGNRMSVVAQKTVSDIGPHWSAEEYFRRVGKSREISR
jgi:2-dehydro-3-deoxygluconokinase